MRASLVSTVFVAGLFMIADWRESGRIVRDGSVQEDGDGLGAAVRHSMIRSRQ